MINVIYVRFAHDCPDHWEKILNMMTRWKTPASSNYVGRSTAKNSQGRRQDQGKIVKYKNISISINLFGRVGSCSGDCHLLATNMNTNKVGPAFFDLY